MKRRRKKRKKKKRKKKRKKEKKKKKKKEERRKKKEERKKERNLKVNKATICRSPGAKRPGSFGREAPGKTQPTTGKQSGKPEFSKSSCV